MGQSHNRQFIGRMPDSYRCPASRLAGGMTTYLLARGNRAAFAPRPGGSTRLVEGDPATTILLVEADENCAVIWTKPEDLEYDPADPGAGLGRLHTAGFFTAPGCFALFANGDVRFLPATADEELLRALLSSDSREKVQLAYSWHETLSLRPVGLLVGPSLLVGLVGVVGLILCVGRLLTGKALSPGEMLWAITGAGSLAHIVAVVAWYRYEPVPFLRRDSMMFWLLPAAAATFVSALGVVRFWSVPAWWAVFVANLVALGLLTLDVTIPHPCWPVEHSFLLASSPVWMGFVGALAVGMTLSSRGRPAWAGRRRAHWVGLCLALLPSLWFLFWFILGPAWPYMPGGPIL
jgi:hypothetical protein